MINTALSPTPSASLPRRRFLRRTLLATAAALALPLLTARAQTPPKETPQYATGAVPSTAAAFARNSRFVIRAKRGDSLPTRVLLTQFLPPVRNQGNQGSCVGWSTAYYAYSYAVAQKRLLGDDDRKTEKFQFSPAFIYHLGNGGNDQGMAISNAMTILKNKGCCTLAEMPYSDKDYLTPPDEAALKRAQRYLAVDVASITQGPGDAAQKMKTFLADMQQPFVIGINVYENFFQAAPNEVYEETAGKLAGRHAITIIGYDEDKHAFRMVNSWGEGWGDKGQLWLSENFIATNAFEAWGFVPGGPRARSIKLPASISVVPPAKTTKPAPAK